MIFVYIYICVSARALHKTVHTLCKPMSAHCALSFGTLAAVRSTTLRIRALWGVTLLIDMANGASSAEDSPDDNSNLSRTHTASYWTQEAPEQGQRLGPYAYSYWTQEVQLKPDCGTEGRTIGSRMTSTYSFLISSYYTCNFPYTSSAYWTYIHTFHVSLLCYYSSFKFINCCMVEVWGMCFCIAYA